MLRILCEHIETSFNLVVFVNKYRCISVTLLWYPRRIKYQIFKILLFHIIVSDDQNISLNFFEKDDSHFMLSHPSGVYFTAQRQYTAVLKMFTNLK